MKPCALDYCDKPSSGRFCPMHYNRWKRHGSFDKQPPTLYGKARADFTPKYGPVCTVDDCDRSSQTRGLCTTHYRRWRETGVVGGPIANRRPATGHKCLVAECDREARQRGWCGPHYSHWYRNGVEPTEPIVSMGTLREFVTYSGAHARLTRAHGLASDHACADCADRAADWSYDNEDPDELIEIRDGVEWAYSLDPSRYAPRCKRCHIRYDLAYDLVPTHLRARKSHCLWGHELNEANTYVGANGRRKCRVCNRPGMRKRRKAMAAS